ncbi:hypothetical protein TASIC1_0006001600 [Trichoderma asperellum]|uniref:Uncharacterized protein n=1 Tax=Trichoderma asperellum TaxID=101201 RepID=A0A6V8QVL1_TRIAP|nr:hypothetical protein TASIC1_0006001600 [Trichoderma asperellum]
MHSILSLAIVAILPLANARFNHLRAESTDTVQCCPCLPSGLNPTETTVTVTVASPKETVTIDQTIVQPATTIFVTQTYTLDSPTVVTVTVHPEPPVKTETVVSGIVGNTDSSITLKKATTKTVTKTVQAGGVQSGESQPESPKTVTVTIKPDQSSSNEMATAAAESKPASSPSASPNSAVTITISQAKQSSSAEPSRPDSSSGNGVTTVTSVQTPEAVETVTVVANPSTTTITLASNPSNSTVETASSMENPASLSSTTVTLAGSPSVSPTVQTALFAETSTSASAAAATPATSSPTSVSSISTINNLAGPNATVTFVPEPLTSSSPPQPAITTPPQFGTISQNIAQFTTLTQTVTAGGTINVEIIIVNIFTGETTCIKKGSGEPCDSKPEVHPSGELVTCLTTGIFTETATAFNTVIVTVESGTWTNGTSATEAALSLATGTGSPIELVVLQLGLVVLQLGLAALCAAGVECHRFESASETAKRETAVL